MMTKEKVQLRAEVRSDKTKVQKLRADKKIPAVVYGHGFENQSVYVDYLPFEKTLEIAGESTLVDLEVGGEAYPVLIQDVQLDPVSDQVIHADFRRVRLDEKVRADVEIKLIGEAPAIKEFGGVLVEALEVVEVEALPGDLMHEFEVAISGLDELGKKIYVGDLSAPEGVEIKTAPDVMIVAVEEAKIKEEKVEKTPEEEEKEALEGQEREEGKEGEEDKESKAGDDKDKKDNADEKKEEEKKDKKDKK